MRIVILCSTILVWGELTIDINLHDTYIVTKYSHFLYPTILWFAVNLILYFVLIKKKKEIGRWTQLTHISLSFLTTFIYIYQVWGSTIAMSGLTKWYFSSNADLQPDGTIVILNFLTFIVIQLVFIITFVTRMVKR